MCVFAALSFHALSVPLPVRGSVVPASCTASGIYVIVSQTLTSSWSAPKHFRCVEVLFLTKTYLGRMSHTRFATFTARHVHGDPHGPVRFGTHCGRVAHGARVRRLHSASRHLRLGGRDLTEYMLKHHTDRRYSFTSPQTGRSLWMSQRNSASLARVTTQSSRRQ